jgi:hypothetical protein
MAGQAGPPGNDNPTGSEGGALSADENAEGGPGQVLGALRREEREAFEALQNERTPDEYAGWVRQYWRNLTRD